MEPHTSLHFGPSHLTIINNYPQQNFGSNRGEEEHAADTRSPETNNPASAAATHEKNNADRSLVAEGAPGIVFEAGPLPAAEHPRHPLVPHSSFNFGAHHFTINSSPGQNFGSNKGEEEPAADTAENPRSPLAEHDSFNFGAHHFIINSSPGQNFGSNRGEKEHAAHTRGPEANNPTSAAAEHGKSYADRSLLAEGAPGIVFEEGPLPAAEHPRSALEPLTGLQFGPKHLTIINNFPRQNFGSNKGEKEHAADTRGPETNNPASAAAEHGKNNPDRGLLSEGSPGIEFEVGPLPTPEHPSRPLAPHGSFNFGAHHFTINSSPRQNFGSNKGGKEHAADTRGPEANNPASATAEHGENNPDRDLVTDGSPDTAFKEEPLPSAEHPRRPLEPHTRLQFGPSHLTIINNFPRQNLGSIRGEEEHAAHTRDPEANKPDSAAAEHGRNYADRSLLADGTPGIVFEAPYASFNFGAHYFTINSSPRQHFGSNTGEEEHAADTRGPEANNPASAAAEHGKNNPDLGLVTNGAPGTAFKEEPLPSAEHPRRPLAPHASFNFGQNHFTIYSYPRQNFEFNRGEEEHATDALGAEANIFNG